MKTFRFASLQKEYGLGVTVKPEPEPVALFSLFKKTDSGWRQVRSESHREVLAVKVWGMHITTNPYLYSIRQVEDSSVPNVRFYGSIKSLRAVIRNAALPEAQ